MTIAHPFDYVRPNSLDEVVEILSEFPGAAHVLAGGTDLVPWMRDDAVFPDLVVDVKRVPDLVAVEERDGALHIGALVTFSMLASSQLVADRAPVLAEAAHMVGSVGIRNRATLVGNVCSAVPSLDGGPPLLVYDAVVHTLGPDGARDLPIGEWFLGPRRTALSRGSIVTGVSLPSLGRHGGCYVKLSRYRGEDLAQAGVAIVVTEDLDYRVAFGAVGPVPARANAIEQVLAGQQLDAELIATAADLVDEAIAPITDMRATARYRAHMCRVMLRRGLEAATGRLRGNGPPHGTELL